MKIKLKMLLDSFVSLFPVHCVLIYGPLALVWYGRADIPESATWALRVFDIYLLLAVLFFVASTLTTFLRRLNHKHEYGQRYFED